MSFYKNINADYKDHLLSMMRSVEKTGNKKILFSRFGDYDIFIIKVVTELWSSKPENAIGTTESHYFKYQDIIDILNRYDKEPECLEFIPQFDLSGDIQFTIGDKKSFKQDCYIIHNCDFENYVV